MVALSFRVYEETVLMTDAERRRLSLNCFPTVTSLISTTKEFRLLRRLNCISDSYTCSGCSRGEVVEYCELATTNSLYRVVGVVVFATDVERHGAKVGYSALHFLHRNFPFFYNREGEVSGNRQLHRPHAVFGEKVNQKTAILCSPGQSTFSQNRNHRGH